MSKRLLLAVLAVGIVVVGVVIWQTTTRPAGAVKIGAILPLTGDAAPYGKAARQAIEMAVEEINGQGGVNGQQLTVVYEDDAVDTKNDVSAANKLCSIDKVKAIIGPMSSSGVEAILPITERNQVVVISPAATASSLSGRKGFFRTIVSDVYDGTAMADFAFQKLGFRKIAVLHVEAAGPGGVARSFIARFKELGGAVPLVETALANATDFRAQLTKIKAAEPDAVYFAAYAVETGTILKQAKELGLNKQMLSHQLAEDPEVRARAGDAANGLIYTTPKLDPATGGPAVKEFYEKFKAKYGEEPRNFASNSYDAIRLLAKAIAQNGSSFDSITKGLLAIKDYPAASGMLSFGANGDVIQPMRIMTIKDGKTAPYAP